MTLMEEFELIENNFGIIALPDPVLQFQGKDCQKFLQGILSNDIRLLKEGEELPAFFLNAKGKWIAALHLFKIEADVFAHTSTLEAQNLIQSIQPLILFSECELKDLSSEYQWILLVGKNVSSLTSQEASIPLYPYPAYRLPSYLILLPRPEIKNWMEKYKSHQISAETLETLRIESALPLFGKDVDEKTIPLEAGFENYFSYTKGCYVGQETISRIKHYGKVNKKLVKIKLENGWRDWGPPNLRQQRSDAEIGGEERQDPFFASAFFQEKEVGKTTSLCYSPFYKANIALGIVNQEACCPGTPLILKTPNEDFEAEVVE